ncbi:MAG: DUF1249 domain-containing protein [Litorivicinaceae bacterium]
MPGRRRHVPDLRRHHAGCALNYSLLHRLERRFGVDGRVSFRLPFGGQECRVEMQWHALGPYTGLVDSQCHLSSGHSTWIPLPAFTVRLYHDMRLAEVTDETSSEFIQGAYPYPNPAMLQPNEREQLDHFLTEWLSFCLHQGLALDASLGTINDELSGTGY